MFDRFSEDARTMMTLARQAALEFHHDYIGTEHMLLGAVATDGTVAAVALKKLGIDPVRVRAEVTKIIRPGRHDETGQLPFTPRGKQVLEAALEEAQQAGHRHIGTGHILLGLLHRKDGTLRVLLGATRGVAITVLNDLGLTLDKARPVVMEVMSTSTDSRDGPPAPPPAIGESFRKLGRDAFAEAARLGHSPVEPEHALLAMLQGDGVAARILRELGATPESVGKRVLELRGS